MVSTSGHSNEVPFLGDKWIASSAMQKAIRRGDIEIARQAAMALSRFDKAMLVRRFQGTVVEDVAPTDVPIISEALASPLGDADISRLMSVLADVPKDRSADNLLFAAQYSPGFDAARRDASKHDMAAITRLLASEEDIVVKAIAVWCAAGTVPYPGYGLPRTYGDADSVFAAYVALDVPASLIEGCRKTLRRVRDPLALFCPLLYLELQRCPDASTEVIAIPAPIMAHGVPLYALGGNTRLGKAAIRTWIASGDALRRSLTGMVDPQGWQKAAEIGLFHAESGLFGLALKWELGERLQCEGIAAEFISIAARPEAAFDFIATVTAELPRLDEIRADLIERTFRSIQPELGFGA